MALVETIPTLDALTTSGTTYYEKAPWGKLGWVGHPLQGTGVGGVKFQAFSEGESGSYWAEKSFSGTCACSVKREAGADTAERYMALWLCLDSAEHSGYRAQVFEVTGSESKIRLYKVVKGSPTLLKESAGFSPETGDVFGFERTSGGKLIVYRQAKGSGAFTVLTEAEDNTFTSGSAALSGAGSNPAFLTFKGGEEQPLGLVLKGTGQLVPSQNVPAGVSSPMTGSGKLIPNQTAPAVVGGTLEGSGKLLPLQNTPVHVAATLQGAGKLIPKQKAILNLKGLLKGTGRLNGRVAKKQPALAGTDHQIKYKFTDLLNGFQTIAELPLKEVSGSKPLNAPGPWSGTLNVEDSKVRESAWLEATAVNRTAMWIDIDGTLIYGGRVQDRRHQLSAGIAELSGDDMTGYFSQRLQAADYKEFVGGGYSWATTGAPALTIMQQVLVDAMQSAYSIPIKIAASGETASKDHWITLSAPREQHQTIASILSQINNLGYLIGIDHALDVSYVDGVPEATCTLHYPRRGRETPWVIDLTSALDLVYDEDGSQQADKVVEIAGATTIRSSQSVWQPAREAGYPLYEAAVSHTSLAPSGDTEGVLKAYVAGYLMAYAFPLTTPVLTLPMFGSPSILDLEVGDNIQLYVPKGAGAQPPNNPRFPEGLSEIFRIVRIDFKIPDQGVPTMELTLNLPPATTPVEPPIVEKEGGSKETKEEINEKEEIKKEEEEKKDEEAKKEEEKRVEEEKKAEEAKEKELKELNELKTEKGLEKAGGITKKNLQKEGEKFFSSAEKMKMQVSWPFAENENGGTKDALFFLKIEGLPGTGKLSVGVNQAGVVGNDVVYEDIVGEQTVFVVVPMPAANISGVTTFTISSNGGIRSSSVLARCTLN